MNIAFYAPLKPPDHPTPSGDRSMARMLLRALRRAGHRVQVMSRLRSLERHGDAAAQARIRARAERVLEHLDRRRGARDGGPPALWFTYHLYHKAPDLLGPELCRRWRIPYVVAEASHAPKQAGGAWDAGFRSAAAALRQAARIVSLNPVDEPCVRALLGSGERMQRLAPFIDVRASMRRADPAAGARLRARAGIPGDGPLLVTVGMMRDGDKLASYRLLGAALERLLDRPWRLLVIGDGPAREAVGRALAGVAQRVHLAGQVPPAELPAWLAGCDLYLWPAVNEAWGMAFLEAAAAGLAAAACDDGGVGAVVRDGDTGRLAPARDEAGFARAVAALLDDDAARVRMGHRARELALASHDLDVAARDLDRVLHRALET